METALNRRPWLVSVGLAFLILLLFRSVVFPGDPSRGLNGSDFQSLFYPLHEYIRNTLLSGTLPLWNPHQYIGHPIVGNPHAALFYPATWFMWLVGVVRGMDLSMVFHAWLGAWGCAVLMRQFGANRTGSLLAGVIYATGGWAASRFYMGHYNLFTVFAWIPWIMAAYQYALKRGTLRSLLPGIAANGLALLAGYPPLYLYAGIGLVTLWLYDVVADDNFVARGWYAGRLLVITLVGGLILGAALVIPTLELTRLSARSDTDLSFANSFALPPAQYLILAIPDLFGNPKVAPTNYWGSDFFEEFTAYVGLLPLLALPLAFRRPRREHAYFIGLVGIGLVMSVGLEGALMPLLWQWVPGLTSFRTPGRALFFVTLGLAGLTALLITSLHEQSAEQNDEMLLPSLRRWLPIAACLAFGGAIFFAGWYASADNTRPMPTRAFMVSGALAATGVILCGVWLALWIWRHPDPRTTRWALLLTCIVVILDLWHFTYPLIGVGTVQEDPIWTGARVNVPTGPDARVVAPGGFENLASVTGHLNVAAYDPLPIETYRKLQASGDPSDPTTPVNTLLGVKYLLTNKPYDKPDFTLIGITSPGVYYRREDAFPRTWIAQNVVVEPNDDAVRQRITGGQDNLQTTVYIDHMVDCPSAGGTASITDYHPNDAEIKTSGNGGLLTLSDQYYPGWQASMDGQPVEIVRADTVFRAMCVPSGDHVVRFEYRPTSFYAGVVISAAGWLALLLLAVFLPRQRTTVPTSETPVAASGSGSR